jgi:TolA-binding protein
MKTISLLALAGVFSMTAAPAALALTSTVAIAATQPPTKQQLETAVKAANPTIGQLRQLKKLEPNINNMTPAQLKQALGNIFSQQQLMAISKSLKAQGVSMPGN